MNKKTKKISALAVLYLPEIMLAFMGIIFLLWLSHAALDAFMLQQSGFFEHLFPAETHERVHIIIISSIFVAFGSFAIVMRRSRTTEKLLTMERNMTSGYLAVMNSMIIMIDTERKVKLINRKGCEILECGEQDIIGTNWFENFIPGRIRQQVISTFSMLITGNVAPVENYENPVVTRNGTEKIIAWHNTVLRDEHGKIYAIMCSGDDVTEQRKIEEKIRHNYETETAVNVLLKASIENLPIEELLSIALRLIFSVSWLKFESTGSVFLVEDEPDVLVMKAQQGLEAPLLAACARIPFGKCLCGKAAAEKKIVFENNVTPVHEISYEKMAGHGHYCVPIMSSGRVIGVINIYVKDGYRSHENDVTFLNAMANTLAGVIERTMAERKLKNRIAFEKLISDISTHFINISPEEISNAMSASLKKVGEYIAVDYIGAYRFNGKMSKAARLYSWQSEQVPSTTAMDEMKTADYPVCLASLSKFENIICHDTAAPFGIYESEKQLFISSLPAPLKSLAVVPMINNRALLGYLLIGTATRLKIWPQEDIAMLRMLGEVFVNAIERKRLENQFIQSQKMEMIGRLAGSVAHDLNNLMTPILGYAQLCLAHLPADNPVREDVNEIYATAERAATLTRQLLAFSRRQNLDPQVINVNEIVREMEKMLYQLINKENIRLATSLDDNVPRTRVDPGQLGQVITNMVVNARDAMPDGGIITLKTSSHVADDAAGNGSGAPAGQYVQISVSDTGTGMTEEVKEHLFEPFYTTKGKGKGTGLGLATCYGIIRQSGGFISVQSEPGKGTEFSILLPISDL